MSEISANLKNIFWPKCNALCNAFCNALCTALCNALCNALLYIKKKVR